MGTGQRRLPDRPRLPRDRDSVPAGHVGGSLHPDATAALWSNLLGRPIKGDIIELDDNAEIRFVPIADGRGPVFRLST
jgi:hypothetical protein